MNRIPILTTATRSAAETATLGESLGRHLRSGWCVALVGPLGAGKTVLAGGVCRGLGVQEQVLSPTFVLYEEFSGRLPVVHIDLYRMEHESELEELGVFDLLGRSVIVAEWADRSDALLAASELVVTMAYVSGDEREIVITAAPEAAAAFKGWTP